MRQRKLGSHTPPCHRRMVITTLFSVLLAALQRRPVLYHTRWLLTVHRHWSSGHLGQLRGLRGGGGHMGHPIGQCAAVRHCWCEGAEGPASDLIKSVQTFRSYDLRGIMQVFGHVPQRRCSQLLP